MRAWMVFAFCITGVAACSVGSAAPPRVAAGTPVVLELYTSQGCSSCPPADRILSGLGADPNLVPLAFHVDYWDSLGWRDPFSSPRWSARQRRYAGGSDDRVYTPELVVGGVTDVVGSNGSAIQSAVAAARWRPPTVRLTVRPARDGRAVTADVAVDGAAGGTLVVALYENGLHTTIARGENAGLLHVDDFVVRDLVEVDAAPA